MDVRRTYGKQRTTALEIPNGDSTFDRLLEKESSASPRPIPRKRDIHRDIHASFNRDSSLDEPKIQKLNNKRVSTRKTKARVKPSKKRDPESSYDSLYESFLREKEAKKKAAKQQRDKKLQAVRNVQVSTPIKKQLRKKTDALLFEVSPIRLNDSGQVVAANMDLSKRSSLKRIRQMRLREIAAEEMERIRLESSATREAKELLAKYTARRASKASVGAVTKIEKTPLKVNFSKVSAVVYEATESMQIEIGEVKNTSAEQTPAPRVLQEKNRDESINRSHSVNKSTMDPPADEDEKENSMKLPPLQDSSFANSLPKILVTSPVDELLPINVMSSVQRSPVELMPQRARILAKMKALKKLKKTKLSSVIKKLPRQVAKKSVAINMNPAIRDISFNDKPDHVQNQPRARSKSVRFTEAPVEQSRPSGSESLSLQLQPGKWRRSLVALRASQVSPPDEPSTTVDTSSAPKRIRYTEHQLETLEESVLLEQSDEGDLHAALSILDASIKCAATFHDQRKTSQRQTSVFQRSSIFYGLKASLIDEDAAPALSARQIVLRRCGQQEPLPFNEIYSESQLPNLCKIGEGVYGEVFMYKCPTTHQPIVLKVIPINGDLLINGEPQKRYDEILQEIVISMELSALRNGNEYNTDGFVNVKRVTCVKGSYPDNLVDEWELYRDNRVEGSDNDHPGVFDRDQVYIVFELCNGGRDLEAFVFNNAEEAQSVFLQTALTLAVAERKFEFEHRDLHWGNLLIAPTLEKFIEYRIDGKTFKVLTNGVKVTIIDYSLSRMVYDGAVLYDNLARDEELFQSTGDYQFDIYRLMRSRVENNFERYEPFTNLLWLHYIVDKLINGARYRYSKTKKHRAAVNEMMQERDNLLNFTSASDYVTTLDF